MYPAIVFCKADLYIMRHPISSPLLSVSCIFPHFSILFIVHIKLVCSLLVSQNAISSLYIPNLSRSVCAGVFPGVCVPMSVCADGPNGSLVICRFLFLLHHFLMHLMCSWVGFDPPQRLLAQVATLEPPCSDKMGTASPLLY